MTSPRPIKKLLIANRGEIATRILATARELDLETYTLSTPSDTSHTLHSNHTIQLPSPSSYLSISTILKIVHENNIDAVHPGYGFLSESPDFAQRLSDEADCQVIGPGPDILRRTGDKLAARHLAEECSVPVLPALSVPTSSRSSLTAFARDAGYPIIIKAVDGGGGRGIRIVHAETELEHGMQRALKESPSGSVFAEKAAIEGFRHVEVQILGDGKGGVRHLWERECSVQRRFQKVVEMAPSGIRDRALVAKVIEAAVRMAKQVNYCSLGTFEFLVREESQEFYFLEVNPRLQVEHTITECLTLGLDLVKIQLQIAQGAALSSLDLSHLSEDPVVPPQLHSLQLRVTAEDVSHDWSLSIGKITGFRFPSGNGIRVDTHLLPGESVVVGTDFDSLLAKIIVTAPSWESVVRKARRALADAYVVGVKTNLDVLHGILASSAFEQQKCDTRWLESHLTEVLKIGKEIAASCAPILKETTSSNAITAPSNVLFRKGDAWSITLTPSASDTAPLPSHLQLTRVLRNEFPSSLSAQIILTAPSLPPTSYHLELAATTASFGSISSRHSKRLGDPQNSNHVIFPTAGKLMEILVHEGDEVKKGDAVAVVSQMKMELEIRSGRGGKVVWVYEGEEGDDVAEGVLAVELEGGGEAKL